MNYIAVIDDVIVFKISREDGDWVARDTILGGVECISSHRRRVFKTLRVRYDECVIYEVVNV